MISYHMGEPTVGNAAGFSKGFKEARLDDPHRLAKGISKFVWSPCIWRNGVRRQENFICAEWCVLDFDSGEMTLLEAKNVFCDTVHIIGTTKSHRLDKGTGPVDRFRVALKFSRLITDLRDYRFAMQNATARYPVDASPKDGARFFFPCKNIISVETEGYLEEAGKCPEWFERPNLARIAAYRSAGVMPPKARAALSDVVKIGERNTTWYCVGKDLTRMGLAFDDIVARIVDSPTYGGKVDRDLLLEIELCVGNGLKAVMREEQSGKGRSEEGRPAAGQSDEAIGPQAEKRKGGETA